MKHIWSVAAKELRGYFTSPVALLFLTTFLGLVLFSFFWWEKFFARGLADVRPMFEWFPLLLIFLVSALTMRLWSEEQRMGTIEILLTLPVPISRFVLGKFLAGFLLVALALLLTVGIPITVAIMGDLDWGPVIGGYLGALLLASAYLAIGLCISAITQHQIISLVFTMVVCSLFYLPGAAGFTGLFSHDTADVLRSIGVGSRFESIARGVIDLRDLVYYASIVVSFLVLNVGILHAKRWSHSPRTASQRFNTLLLAVLTGANAIAANLWLGPVRARLDLTEEGLYEISDATEKILRGLDDPLVLRAYMSKKTHPLVEPLIPQIKDILAEYSAVGGDKVRVEYSDPLGDEELERETAELYGIRPAVFKFRDRRETAVVNAYFSLLIKYGDQHEALDLLQLIEEVRQEDINSVELRLRNAEYDLTRAIKKAVQGFQNMDLVFASLPEAAKLTLYVTPDTLPADLKDAPAVINKVAEELTREADGKFEFAQVTPKTRDEQIELVQKYGIRPVPILFSDQYFYFHLLLQVGSNLERLQVDELTEPDVKNALTEAVRRGAPGYLKTVGMWAPKGFTLPAGQFGPRPQEIPPPQSFELLRDQLSQDHRIIEVDLDSGRIGGEVDVLLVAGPDSLDAKAQYAIDQFLMRGGAVVLLAGRYRMGRGDLSLNRVNTGLDEMLKTYGVEIPQKLVMDPRNEKFATLETVRIGGQVYARVRDHMAHPPSVFVPADELASDTLITQRLHGLVLPFASPVLEAATTGGGESQSSAATDKTSPVAKDSDKPDLERQVLFSSSADAWLKDTTAVFSPASPDLVPPDDPEGKKGPFPLAVVLRGGFVSHFRDKGEPGNEGDSGAESEKQKKTDRTLMRSPPGTRLVVFGTANFVSDEGLVISKQLLKSDRSANAVALVQNTIDWAVSDADLLTIRLRGGSTRVLETESNTKWEAINLGLAVFALLGVALLAVLRRRMIVPFQLLDRNALEAAASALGDSSEGSSAWSGKREASASRGEV